MKTRNFISALLLIFLSLSTAAQISDEYLEKVSDQLIKMDNIIDGRWPLYTIDGVYKFIEEVNWLSGFTGGGLWNLYELTGDEELKSRAIKHADALIEFAGIDYTHDMGFIFFPTVVRAYKYTGEEKYKLAGIEAARMLVKRFNSNGNFLRAWGKLGDPDKSGWMIIDTMMNLELLFWAWQQTDDYTLYDIAYKHAITCMKESIRPDYSSHHVIEFDPDTGEVIKKRTHQGLNDESTWARGQAWGIYGFANIYKYTEDKRFLNTSKKLADVFIQALPEDSVPYWDLTLSGDDVVRDASAGAIAASGMYILADVTNSNVEHIHYKKYADRIAESIVKNYSFISTDRDEEQGLLLHTVYNYHKDWGVDESYTCGDFYYTEVLKRYLNNN